jgi:RNA recognition motif-containing protein
VIDSPTYATNVAYVDMESEEAAKAAIVNLNGMDVQGTTVRVSLYRSREERDRHRQEQEGQGAVRAGGMGMTGTAMAQATVAVHMPMVGLCTTAKKVQRASSGGVLKVKGKKKKCVPFGDGSDEEW